MAMEGAWTWGGKHTKQHIDHVLQNCTLETCMILLTSVIPINVIKNRTRDEMLDISPHMSVIYIACKYNLDATLRKKWVTIYISTSVMPGIQ